MTRNPHDPDGRDLPLDNNKQHGDHYNITCPWCGKNNTYVTRGVSVSLDEIRAFTKTCQYCPETIAFTAHWELKVEARRYNPDDRHSNIS